MHFWPKNHFLAERKNDRFSVIPAWTGSVVILGYFLMARMVPPSFVEKGPKLRVHKYKLVIGEWPETAKNKCEPRKMTHSIRLGFFGGGGPNGKVLAPGMLVICPVDKNCDYHTKNWLLAPNIQILGSKKQIFAPSGQLEPHRSMFSTQKRCLIRSLIRGYQKFYSIPQ